MSEDSVKFLGIGSRKTSIARVRNFTGSGVIVVNCKPIQEYCYQEVTQRIALSPLTSAYLLGIIDAHISFWVEEFLGKWELFVWELPVHFAKWTLISGLF